MSKDLSVCEICGAPATKVVVTDKGTTAFCTPHFEPYWNVIPTLLAKMAYAILTGGK